MKRTSTITWKGPGKTGSGTITTQSKVLNETHYAWNTRFENSMGTNPEELIAAAHAACFTMKLSFLIGEAGFIPEIIETTSEVTLEKDSISRSHLIVQATVPAMRNDKFQECAADARDNCLVSRALNMDITMAATLKEKIMA
jgi:lipoyl-dependent peroxiredoxin